MTSEELQWAVKSLIAGMIWTSGRNDTEAQVWDEVDALFAERTRRDATPAPVDPSSTVVASSRGGPWADGITDQEMVRICMDSTNLLMQAGRQQELLYSVIDGSIREAIAIDRGHRIIRCDAVPRFTAEEVAKKLVKMDYTQVGSSVVIDGVIDSPPCRHDLAEKRQNAWLAAIIRTLEAKP